MRGDAGRRSIQLYWARLTAGETSQLDAAEVAALLSAYERNGGNVGATAIERRVDRQTVRKWVALSAG